MRVTLLLLGILVLGLLDSTDALCDLKNGNTAICDGLNDVQYIDSSNLMVLKASVYQKSLRSTSLKNLSSDMKSLDLSDGEIEIVEAGTFQGMTGLLDLKMSDNSIAQLTESALAGLDKLKNFELRRNNIRELPRELTKLKALKNLEISGNPLICNCATLRVRDDLLANGVKISKKVFCAAPSHLKGVSLLEPETEVICMFEVQDNEMQADQAAGSGDGNDELGDDFGELTEVPPAIAARVLVGTDVTPEIITDDLIIPELGTIGNSSDSIDTTNYDDFVFASHEESDDSLIVEASGLTESEKYGSGDEGSGASGFLGLINPDDFLEEVNEPSTSTTEEPTTESPSWFDVIANVFTGNTESTTATVENESEKSLVEEEFITMAPEATATSGSILQKGIVLGNIGVTEEEVVTKKTNIQTGAVVPGNNSKSVTKSDKAIEDFAPSDTTEDTSVDDFGEASTHQSKKSMGSYVVLAALLGVLAALVGFAAYKSTFCKKKPNNDPERGSELKDVHKALLDTNSSNQPKIASNGNTENAPLVEPTQETWASHQEIRPWTDQKAPARDNGAKDTPPVVESDPVKPPRKSLPAQEETNGLQEVKTHPPMSTFAPRTHASQLDSITPPNSPSSAIELRSHSPPLSPNAQRVKITLQENPDSVPKTPILITRTKPGVNLVKLP